MNSCQCQVLPKKPVRKLCWSRWYLEFQYLKIFQWWQSFFFWKFPFIFSIFIQTVSLLVFTFMEEVKSCHDAFSASLKVFLPMALVLLYAIRWRRWHFILAPSHIFVNLLSHLCYLDSTKGPMTFLMNLSWLVWYHLQHLICGLLCCQFLRLFVVVHLGGSYW